MKHGGGFLGAVSQSAVARSGIGDTGARRQSKTAPVSISTTRPTIIISRTMPPLPPTTVPPDHVPPTSIGTGGTPGGQTLALHTTKPSDALDATLKSSSRLIDESDKLHFVDQKMNPKDPKLYPKDTKLYLLDPKIVSSRPKKLCPKRESVYSRW